MGRIEIAAGWLKQEGFRFLQSIERERNRLAVLQPLLDLLLAYQLLSYSLMDVLHGFPRSVATGVLMQVMGAGLQLAQQTTYNATYHVIVGAMALAFCLLFPTQALRNRWLADEQLWQKLEGVMFALAALVIWASPVYYLAAPKHLYALTTQSSGGILYAASFGLLPFWLVFLAGSFILNSGSLVNWCHLLIPVCDILGLRNQLSSLVLIISCALSLWLQPRTRRTVTTLVKQVAVALAFITLNVWAAMELQLASFATAEGLFGGVLCTAVFAASMYRPANSLQGHPLEQAKLLESLIEAYDKPVSQRKELEAECLFLRHFLECSVADKTSSFCGGCSFLRKPLLKLPKDSLCQLLEEKIEHDRKQPKHQHQLSTELVRFRFFRNKNPLKLYRDYWREGEASHSCPLSQQYSMYSTLQQLKRVLNKQAHGNLPILARLERIRQEQQLCAMLGEQLNLLEVFWRELQANSEDFDMQPQLQRIVNRNSEIYRRRDQLRKVQPLTPQREELFRQYSLLFEEDSEQAGHQLEQKLGGVELQPIYLLTDSQTISKASEAFLRLYGFDEKDLLGKSISALLPKCMHSLHEQKLREWSGCELTASTLKLLQSARGHIETFMFTLQLYPNLEKGLQYVAFLQPQEHARHFLYNINDDCFVGFSESLADVLAPLGFEVRPPEQCRYRCQDIFAGVNLKNLPTLEQLREQTLQRQLLRSSHTVDLRIVNEYRIGSSLHLALVSYARSMGKSQTRPQRPTFIETPQNTEMLLRKEKILEAKSSTRKPSRVSRILLLEGLALLVVLLSYFSYRFGIVKTGLDSFENNIQNTTRCLETRFYFSQVVMKSLQLYSAKVVPSTLSSSARQEILTAYQSELAAVVALMNNATVQKLSNSQHYDMFQLMQTITNDIVGWSVETILSSVSRIHYLVGLNFGVYTSKANVVQLQAELGVVGLVLLLHLILNAAVSIRTETLIPQLKKLHKRTSPTVLKRKQRRMQKVRALLQQIEDPKQKTERTPEAEEETDQQTESKSEPSTDASDKRKQLLFNTAVPFLMGVVVLGVTSYLSLAFNQLEKEKQIIARLQLSTFSQSLTPSKIGMLMYMGFAEQSPRQSSDLLASDMKELQQVDPTKMLIKNGERIPKYINIFDGWLISNQNMCVFLYDNDNPNPEEMSQCSAIASSVGTFGQSNSLNRFLQMVAHVASSTNITERYADGTLQAASLLSKYLSKYAMHVYKHYLEGINDYIAYQRVLSLLVLMGTFVSLVVCGVLMWLDYRRKARRIDLLKELFRMLPDHLLMQEISLKVFVQEESLLQAVRKV